MIAAAAAIAAHAQHTEACGKAVSDVAAAKPQQRAVLNDAVYRATAEGVAARLPYKTCLQASTSHWYDADT